LQCYPFIYFLFHVREELERTEVKLI
jgi:hypothetical protein